MAAIVPADLRLLPRDLVSVRYLADAAHHERVTLLPIGTQQWVTLSPDGVMHSEQLRHFARVQKITGTGAYPVGVSMGGILEMRPRRLLRGHL